MVPISSGVYQSYDANTKGGYHEIAIGLAGNIEDKLYVGGSLTIPITYYERDFIFLKKMQQQIQIIIFHSSTTMKQPLQKVQASD